MLPTRLGTTSLLRATFFRRSVSRLAAALTLASLAHPALAAPVTDQNSGTSTDSFQDNAGIANIPESFGYRHDPFGQLVTVANDASIGQVTSLLVSPVSFDAWGRIYLDYTATQASDIEVYFLSESGTFYPDNPTNPDDGSGFVLGASDDTSYRGMASLSGVPASVTSGRVVIKMKERVIPVPDADPIRLKPVVSAYRITWTPRSVVRAALEAPTSTCSNQTYTYRVRVSVSLVNATNVLAWLPLDLPAADPFGRRYALQFRGASNNGTLVTAETVIDGVTIPANSVVWELGNVNAGHTFVVTADVAPPVGALDTTTYRSTAFARATNANQVTSSQVATTNASAPQPFLRKTPTGAFNIGGTWYIDGGRTLGYNLYLGNYEFPPQTCTEAFHETVIIDDVTDLVAPTEGSTFGSVFVGSPATAFTISDGGQFTANQITLTNGVVVPANSIYWDLSTLEVGDRRNLTYSLLLKADVTQVNGVLPANHRVDNGSRIVSGFAPESASSAVSVFIDIPNTPVGIYAKGDKIRGSYGLSAGQDNWWLSVGYGEPVTFLLGTSNNGASQLDNTLMVDKVPAGTTFNSAFLPASVAGTIYYNTTGAGNAGDAPPGVTLATGVLDGTWTTALPANPATVRWVAFRVPKLASPYFPVEGLAASTTAEFTVTVDNPVNGCPVSAVNNTGLFRTYAYTGVGETQSQNVTGIASWVTNAESVDVKPVVPSFEFMQVNANPQVVSGTGDTTFNISIPNQQSGGVETDTALNVVVDVVMPRLAINGTTGPLPFVSATAPGGVVELGGLPDTLRVRYASIPPLQSRNIAVRVNVPKGYVSGSGFTLTASAAGNDDVCGPVSRSAARTVTANGNPYLQVAKRVDLGVASPQTDLRYTLTYQNVGDAVSTQSWVLDRLPANARFVISDAVPGNGELWFSASTPPALPADLRGDFSFTDSYIRSQFTRGTTLPNGTIAAPAGMTPIWVAYLIDNSALTPAQFPSGNSASVRYTVKVANTAPAGSNLRNEAAILSQQLLPAVSNEVTTIVSFDPSIEALRSCPDVVAADNPTLPSNDSLFTWTLDYVNNSTNDDYDVVITEQVPAFITLVSATHTWNTAANQTYSTVNVPAVINGQTVTVEPTKAIASNNAIPLRSFEGGRITFTGRVAAGTASGTFADLGGVVIATDITRVLTTSVFTGCRVLVENADLAIRKAVDEAAPVAGEEVTYTLVVSNQGANVARGVAVVDTLPLGVTYVPDSTLLTTTGWSFTGSSAPTITTVNGAQRLTWSVATGNALTRAPNPAGLFPGSSGDVSISFRARLADTTPPATTLTNNVAVSTTSGEDATHPNTASVDVRTPLPDPYVIKTGATFSQPGQVVTYRLRYGNASRQASGPVLIVDKLFDGPAADGLVDVTYVGHVANNGETVYFNAAPLNGAQPAFNPANPAATGWRTSAAGGAVNWVAFYRPNLAGNLGPLSIFIDVALKNPATGLEPQPGAQLLNLGSIGTTGPNPPPDDDPTNNTSSVTTQTPGIDIGVSAVCTPEGAFPGTIPGAPATLVIELVNNGTVTAFGLNVGWAIPSWFTFSGDTRSEVVVTTASGGAGNLVSTTGAALSGPVAWTFSNGVYRLGSSAAGDPLWYRRVGLPAGSKATLTIEGSVSDAVASETAVTQAVTASTDYRFDFNPAVDDIERILTNNAASCGTTIYRADPLVIKTAASGAFGAGDRVRYEVAYNNAGAAPAGGVVIEDYLPEISHWVVGSEVDIPGEGTLEFDNGSGSWGYTPTGATGSLDLNVKALRIRFAGNVPAPAGATFSQNTTPDFASGFFAGTLASDDSVRIDSKRGANAGTYLSPVIPGDDAGNVLSWGRVVVEATAIEGAMVLVDVLDATSGEVLVAGLDPTADNAWSLVDIDPNAHPKIQLRASLEGSGFACDPHNDVVFQLPSEFPTPASAVGFGCAEDGLLFGLELFGDPQFGFTYVGIAWEQSGNNYAPVTLPTPAGVSYPVFGFPGGGLFGPNFNGSNSYGWARGADGLWTTTLLGAFAPTSTDYARGLVGGIRGNIPAALSFANGIWSDISLPRPEADSPVNGQVLTSGARFAAVVYRQGLVRYDTLVWELDGASFVPSVLPAPSGVSVPAIVDFAVDGSLLLGQGSEQIFAWSRTGPTWQLAALPREASDGVSRILDGDTVVGYRVENGEQKLLAWIRSGDTWTRTPIVHSGAFQNNPIQLDPNGRTFYVRVGNPESMLVVERSGSTFDIATVSTTGASFLVLASKVISSFAGEVIDLRQSVTEPVRTQLIVEGSQQLQVGLGAFTSQQFDARGIMGCGDAVGYGASNIQGSLRYTAHFWPITPEVSSTSTVLEATGRTRETSIPTAVEYNIAYGRSTDEDGIYINTFWDLTGGGIEPQPLTDASAIVGVTPYGQVMGYGNITQLNSNQTVYAWTLDTEGVLQRQRVVADDNTTAVLFGTSAIERERAPNRFYGYIQNATNFNYVAWLADPDAENGFVRTDEVFGPDANLSSDTGLPGGLDFTSLYVNKPTGSGYYAFDVATNPATAHILTTPEGQNATYLWDAGANGTLTGYVSNLNSNIHIWYRAANGWSSKRLDNTHPYPYLADVTFAQTGHPLAAAESSGNFSVWAPDGLGEWTRVEFPSPAGYGNFRPFRSQSSSDWPSPAYTFDRSGFDAFGFVGGAASVDGNTSVYAPVYQHQRDDGSWLPLLVAPLDEGGTVRITAVGAGPGGDGVVIYGVSRTAGDNAVEAVTAWTFEGNTLVAHELMRGGLKVRFEAAAPSVTAPTEAWGSLALFDRITPEGQRQLFVAIPTSDGFDVQPVTSMTSRDTLKIHISPKNPWIMPVGNRESNSAPVGLYGCGLGSGVSLDSWQVLFRSDKNPSFSYELSVPDVCQQQMVNTASIRTTSPQITTANDSSTATVPVQTADLEVTLTSNPGVALTGDVVTWSWTVTNNGPAAAKDVALTVGIPFGDGAGGDSDVYELGTLAVGATQSGTFDTTVTTEAFSVPLVGNATLSSPTIDCTTANDSASATTFTGNLPNVTVSIDAPPVAVIGTPFEVVYTATNNGNSTAGATTLVVDLPTGTSVVSVTTEGAVGTCVPTTASRYTCTIPSLAAERNEGSPFILIFELLTAECAATGTTAGTSASVSTALESNAGDNNASDTIGIDAPAGRLEVTAFAGRATAEPGDVVTYTVFYRNSGSGPITAPTLTATVPTGTTLVAGSATAGATPVGQTLTLVLPDLAPGAQGALTFNALVTANIGATLTGSASMVGANASACPASAPYDNVRVTGPGLHIVKQASAGLVCGGTLDWTITVMNTSPDLQTNLVVTDRLPPQTQYIAGSIQGVGANAIAAPTLSWNIGMLAGNRSLSLGYRTQAPASSGVVPVNVATLEQGGQAVGSTTRIPVRSDCNHGGLTVDKAWNAACAQPGEVITVAFTAVNTSSRSLTGVTLTDSLPVGLEFVASQGFTYNPTTRVATATIGQMAAGGRTTLALSATVTVLALNDLVFDTARITAVGLQPQASNQVIGAVVSCNDGNVCTRDICNPFVGCVNTLTPLPGVADNTCNGIDDNCNAQTDEAWVVTETSCGVGVCAATGSNTCPPGSTAPVDTCVAGNPLSEEDNTCDNRDDNCSGAADEDYISYTFECGDFCDGVAPTSCVNGQETWDCQPRAADTACDDANQCSDQSTCDGEGNCISRRFIACNDGNDCTTDSCSPVAGCVFANVENGTSCNDDNECTLSDTCTAGLCGGTAVSCGTPDECQFPGVCNPSTGVCDYEIRPGNTPVPIGLTDLGTLGGTTSRANAIATTSEGSAGGLADLVVGQSTTAGGDVHAFAWTTAGMVDLTPGQGITSAATGVNTSGLVVGTRTSGETSSVFSWTSAGGLATLFSGANPSALAPTSTNRVVGVAGGRAWYSADGRAAATELAPPTGGSDVTPRAINDAGFVVGQFTAAGGAKRAFVATPGLPAVAVTFGDESDALAVNNGGEAVGWVAIDSVRRAHLFRSSGTGRDLGTLGGASWAVAISDTGFVIGASENADGELRAIAWTEESGLLDLGALAGGESEALFVVDEGLAAGTSTTLLGTTETLLWSIAEPPLLTALDLVGASVASPIGLIGSGLIAGNLETTTGTRAFVWEEHRGTEDIGTLGGTTARATAVADNGRVVGEAATTSGDLHAFVSAIPETACIVCDEDTTPPALVCPVVRRAVECTGTPGTSVTLGNPSVSDACGRPVDVTNDAPAVYPTGSTVVTYTATDSEDNVATCTTTVLVADTTAPVINCAPTLAVDAPEGVCGAAVTLTATATDACDGNTVTLIGPNGSLDNAVVFGPGETRVSITAIDAAGNRSTCETLVTVTGLDPFEIVCDEDLTVQAPADFCGYPEAITATVRDVCAEDLTVESASDSYPLGLTNVLFEGSNERGDTDTCTTRLTVVDVTPPTIDCGVPEALREFPTAFTPVATDACSATYVIEGVRCVAIDGTTETVLTESCDVVVQDGVSVVVRQVPAYDAAGKVIPADRLEVRWSVTATDPSGNATDVDCAAGLDLDDRDRDNDGIPDLLDNCPDTANTDQLDTDGDGMGDVCDDEPLTGLTAEGSGGCAGGGQAGLLGLALGLLALAATRRLYRTRGSN